MSDMRFNDVVIESNAMIGPDGEYHTAICKTCSQQHKVTKEEFQLTDLYKIISTEDGYETTPANALEYSEEADDILQYVAEMRSWRCCHEGQEPLDGFPDEPEVSRIEFEQ